jgi:hypothetical protein
MPVGLVSLSYEEKTTIEDLARLYGGFSLLKLRAMKTSYPLLALLLLSCCNEIKPICPDVECVAPIKIEPSIEDEGGSIRKQLRGYSPTFSYEVCLL